MQESPETLFGPIDWLYPDATRLLCAWLETVSVLSSYGLMFYLPCCSWMGVSNHLDFQLHGVQVSCWVNVLRKYNAPRGCSSRWMEIKSLSEHWPQGLSWPTQKRRSQCPMEQLGFPAKKIQKWAGCGHHVGCPRPALMRQLLVEKKPTSRAAENKYIHFRKESTDSGIKYDRRLLDWFGHSLKKNVPELPYTNNVDLSGKLSRAVSALLAKSAADVQRLKSSAH